MRRVLLLLLGVLPLLWWSGLLRRTRRTIRGAGRGEPAVKQGGRMVRDRVCNTFLPVGRALVARVEGEDHFFCSTACREAFRSGVKHR